MASVIKDNSKLAHFVRLDSGRVYYIESSDLITDIYYIGNDRCEFTKEWAPIYQRKADNVWKMCQEHYGALHDIEKIVREARLKLND